VSKRSNIVCPLHFLDVPSAQKSGVGVFTFSEVLAISKEMVFMTVAQRLTLWGRSKLPFNLFFNESMTPVCECLPTSFSRHRWFRFLTWHKILG